MRQQGSWMGEGQTQVGYMWVGSGLPLLTAQHNLLNTLTGHTWSNLPQTFGMRSHAPRVERLLAGPSVVAHSLKVCRCF